MLLGVWPDQRGAKEGRWGGLIKGKNVAIVRSRYVCVFVTNRKKGREERKADQILLQVFHKHHNSANRFPSPSLVCSSRFLPLCWRIRLMAFVTYTLQ